MVFGFQFSVEKIRVTKFFQNFQSRLKKVLAYKNLLKCSRKL